jgi:hypothetical protein
MENLVYVRTDKNGTEIYHDYTCRRCGGAGFSDKWYYTGRTCYECGGKGVSSAHPQIVRKYTPEYEAKLEAKREARRKKQEQERRAKAEQLNAEFLAEHFPNGKMYIVANSYDCNIDDLKAAGAKFTYFYWYFTDPQEKFLTVEVTPNEVTFIDHYGTRMFSNRMDEVVRAKVKALEPVSQWVGNVDEKITVKATYTHRAWYDSKFGTTYIHNFTTADGSLLVWKTSKGNIGFEDGDHVEIAATVKEHSEYKGKKQTALTRCKITQG